MNRLFIIVLDSFGIGELPDAEKFGDKGCNTLRSVTSSPEFDAPNLKKLGLFNIEGASAEREPSPAGAFGRATEKSMGKDTTTGHWEIAGIISKSSMPTFPDGFPPEVTDKLEKAFGRKILCNKPYSGTEVIHDYGREHEATGALIVYSSADSVLQIAAHESIASREELYGFCKKARAVMTGDYAVGRVIARPFVGKWPDYERTDGRHDFSIEPPGRAMPDAFFEAGLASIGVGKISDIFAARGISRHIATSGNRDGMEKTIKLLSEDFKGLCFVNLVDFDMKYGHRRDIDGYARAIREFDGQLEKFMAGMGQDDALIITADHGCDPGFPGSDHTREYIPVLVYGDAVKPGTDIGTRETFADIAATAAEIFGLDLETLGKSFWNEIIKK